MTVILLKAVCSPDALSIWTAGLDGIRYDSFQLSPSNFCSIKTKFIFGRESEREEIGYISYIET